MSADLIVVTEGIRVGTRDYAPADRFEREDHLKSGAVNERTVELLLRQRKLKPLTRETYHIALNARRGDVGPPLGFEPAYLVAKGIIDSEADAAPAATPAAKVAAGEVIRTSPRNDDTVPVGLFFMTPVKRGVGVVWDVTDFQGNLLRPRGFRDEAKAREFLEGLTEEAKSKAPAAASTDSTASGNAGGEPENTDDRDLQSESVRRDEPSEVPPGRHEGGEPGGDGRDDHRPADEQH